MKYVSSALPSNILGEIIHSENTHTEYLLIGDVEGLPLRTSMI